MKLAKLVTVPGLSPVCPAGQVAESVVVIPLRPAASLGRRLQPVHAVVSKLLIRVHSVADDGSTLDVTDVVSSRVW
jgi:hypothetical protein